MDIKKKMRREKEMDQNFGNEQQNGYYQSNGSYNNYGYSNYQPNYQQQVQANPTTGFGVASLILGILSLVLSFTVIFSFLTAILAVIFGIIQLTQKSAQGYAIAGIICAVLGFLATIFFGYVTFRFFDEYRSHRANSSYYDDILDEFFGDDDDRQNDYDFDDDDWDWDWDNSL